MTGHKIDDTIGELSSTGNENVIHHFEGVFSHSLPSVPSIAVDQQHKPFPFWCSIFWHPSNKVLLRSQEETN